MNYDFRFFSREGNKEVDFIKVEKNKIIPVEVKYSDNIKEKEIKGLLNFIEKNNLKKGIVITKSSEDKKMIKGSNIQFIPLWKWLLEK